MNADRANLGLVMSTFVTLCTNMHDETQRNIERRRRDFRRRMRLLHNRHAEVIAAHYEMINRPLVMLMGRPAVRNRGPNKMQSEDWWERIVQNHFTEADWVANFRMQRESFENLCHLLEEALLPSAESVQKPITVRKKVAITLYKLASCSEYRVVANQFGVHKSTVQQTFYSVVKAINNVIMPTSIVLPNEVEAREIAYLVQEKTNFPQAFLAIDGSHIPVLPPREGYRDFSNRKGWASVVLQGVVDHRYRFRDISCILPGSAHDARVLAESHLYMHAEEVIPKGPQVINGMEVNLMVLGDAAYPLLPWLMKGFTGILTSEQESFNVYLSSFRIGVEIAFGRLKARWRCLAKRIDVHYSFVPKVVAACCTLHNYVENGKQPFLDQWLEDVHQADIVFPQPEPLRPAVRDDYNMSHVRDHLCRHLATTLPLRQSSFRLNPR